MSSVVPLTKHQIDNAIKCQYSHFFLRVGGGRLKCGGVTEHCITMLDSGIWSPFLEMTRAMKRYRRVPDSSRKTLQLETYVCLLCTSTPNSKNFPDQKTLRKS